MDRDQRWNRTEKAYNLYTDPEIASDTRTPDQVLEASYAEGPPMSSSSRYGFRTPSSRTATVFSSSISDHRARQIVQALCLPDFDAFERTHRPQVDVVTFRWNRTSRPGRLSSRAP